MKDDPHPASPSQPPDRGSPVGPALDETQTLIPAAQRLGPGAVVENRYRIEKFLGMGGMGRVYLARDLELDQDVALKIIRPELLQDGEATERFKRELVLARRVSHRNVVRIHDLGEFEGLKYLTMSYIEGRSLKELLKESGRFPADRAASLLTQAAEAVAAAHAEGVVHRDLKPANIMIDGEDRVFVTDFGIARSLDSEDLTMAGAVVGTPAYLSPEQAQGAPADARSDIYALGLMLHEMLAGKLPGRDRRGAGKTLGDVEPRPPEYLIRIAEKCLADNPDSRYSTVEELLADLRGQTVAAPLRPSRPRRLWAAVGIAATLAAVLLAVWLAPRLSRPTPAGAAPVASVLVLPFSSPAGEEATAWLPAAVSDLLISDLGQETRLRVVSGDRVHQTLLDLKLEPGVFSPDVVKRLSQILDAQVVIQGSVTRSGSQVRADAQLLTPATPGQPAYLQATAPESQLFAAVADLASQVKKRLRLDASSAAAAHTPSLATLEHFQNGALALRRGDFETASRLLRQAVESDPRYLPSYLKLSEAEENAGRPDEAVAVLESAFSVKDGDRGELDMIHARHALLNGDLAQSIEIYQRLAAAHPNDPDMLFELALAHEQSGDLAKASAALDKVVRLDPNHPTAYFHLGKDTILMGEAEKAVGDYLLRALGIATQLGNKADEADVLNAIGVAYQRLGRYDEAIKYFNDSIAIKESLGNKRSAGTSLSNIAKIHIARGEFEEAEKILTRNLELFDQAGYLKGVADVHNNFGVLNEDRGRFPAALDSYKRSLQLRKQLGDDRLTAQSYDNVGYIYYLLGEYDNAQVYWQQALDLKTAIGEDAGVILSTQNMGFLHYAQGEIEPALKSFLVSLDRGRAIKFDNAVAVSLGNLAAIYESQGRYQAALESYEEALALMEKLGDKKGLAEYTKQLGSALLDLGAWDEAEGRVRQAMELAREIRNQEIVAELHILTARLQRLRGDLDQASKSLEEAVGIAAKPGLGKVLVRSRIERAWLDIERGDLREASASLLQTRREADSLANFWLGLETRLAQLGAVQKRGDPGSVRKMAGEILQLCRNMGLKPVEMQLYSAEGEAALAQGDAAKGGESLRRAAALFREIEADTPERYRAGLTKLPGAPTSPAVQKQAVN